MLLAAARRPPSRAELQAALWSWRASSRAHRQLTAGGLPAVALPAVPRGADGGVRGVEAMLRRRSATCLERALVRQAWLAAHGESQQIVIGVRRDGGEFGAHAWLEREAGADATGFTELMRHPGP